MSKAKVTRLLHALSNESVRRVPYVFLLLIILSLVQFTRLQIQTAHGVQIAKDNAVDAKTLLTKVASLSEDNKQLITQNKSLTEQNIQIANDNAKHLDCLADLFARYTRTGQAIYAIDLNSCMVITQKGASTPSTTAPRAAQPSSTSPGVAPSASSSPQSTPSTTPSLPNISQTPPATSKPNLLHRILNFVGL